MSMLCIGRDYPSFVAEAKSVCASRNVPLASLKALERGEEILRSVWEPVKIPDPAVKEKWIGADRLLWSLIVTSVYDAWRAGRRYPPSKDILLALRKVRTAISSYRKRRSVKALQREASVSRQQRPARMLTKIEV